MKGVLLVNLGSPDSPEPEDVKPYLDQFLMDKYVLDFPWLFRAFLVRGIILRKRPEESSHAMAYCGYSGKSSTSSTPLLASSLRPVSIDGLP